MEDIIGKSLWIAIKIWIIAIIFNTLIGAFFLGETSNMLFLVLIFGAVCAAVFSFPVVVILFVLLAVLAKLRYSLVKSMTIIYITGLICALSCGWIFFRYEGYREFNFIFFTASLSGVLAILTQTNAIRRLIFPKNIMDELLNPVQKETELV
jgi:hypothetical protein